jgi:hypothetical protein
MVTTYSTDMDADSAASKRHNQRPDSLTMGLELPRYPSAGAGTSGTVPCAYSTLISPLLRWRACTLSGVPALWSEFRENSYTVKAGKVRRRPGGEAKYLRCRAKGCAPPQDVVVSEIYDVLEVASGRTRSPGSSCDCKRMAGPGPRRRPVAVRSLTLSASPRSYSGASAPYLRRHGKMIHRLEQLAV